MAIATVQNNRYTVESLYQWDLNQVLEIRGLSLASIPEIHFTNDAMDRAIVIQSTMDDAGVITANIPNSLLQKPYEIKAYVCVYEGETFESLYLIEIPVKARNKPNNYTFEDNVGEVYSFNALENLVNNTVNNLTVYVSEKTQELTASNEALRNAVDTRVKYLENYVTPEMFGAVGDGKTDDTEALTSMLNSNNNVFVFGTGKVYLISERVEIEKNNVLIIGNGATLKATDSLTTITTPSYYGLLTLIGENIHLNSLNIDCSKRFVERTDSISDEYVENTNDYYSERGRGLHGLIINNCKNVIIDNCNVKNSILGICSWFSERVTIQNCSASYTLADGIATYSGNKNVKIDNCICSHNGDDAFPVFASSLPSLGSQTENVIVTNCKSFNCYSRALLNHGGKNVIFDNIIIENARQFLCVLGQGFGDYEVYETDNTFVSNVIGSIKNYPGFDSSALGQLEYTDDLTLDNIFVYPTDESEYTKDCYLKYGNGNIEIRNSTLKFFNLYGERETNVKLFNCQIINSFSHSKCNYTNLTVRDCKFTNDGSYLFTVSSGKYLDIKNAYGDNKKIAGALIENSTIKVDNANQFSAGFFAKHNVSFYGLQVVDALLSVFGLYALYSSILVQGVLYFWNGSEWTQAT